MQRLSLEEPHVGPLPPLTQEVPPPLAYANGACLSPILPLTRTGPQGPPHTHHVGSRHYWGSDSGGSPRKTTPAPTPLCAAFVTADLAPGMIRTPVLGAQNVCAEPSPLI